MADAPFYASILDGATFPPLHYPTMLVMLNFQSAYLLQNNIIMVEVVSKELNHFGVIADLFRQIGGHSSRFVLFCSFWRLFTIKMIESVKVFPFSFWKIITRFFFYFIKLKPLWFNSMDTNSRSICTTYLGSLVTFCDIVWFWIWVRTCGISSIAKRIFRTIVHMFALGLFWSGIYKTYTYKYPSFE